MKLVSIGYRRLGQLLLAALVVVVIGSAAAPLPQHGPGGPDPATVFNLRPAVPDGVLPWPGGA